MFGIGFPEMIVILSRGAHSGRTEASFPIWPGRWGAAMRNFRRAMDETQGNLRSRRDRARTEGGIPVGAASCETHSNRTLDSLVSLTTTIPGQATPSEAASRYGSNPGGKPGTKHRPPEEKLPPRPRNPRMLRTAPNTHRKQAQHPPASRPRVEDTFQTPSESRIDHVRSRQDALHTASGRTAKAAHHQRCRRFRRIYRLLWL